MTPFLWFMAGAITVGGACTVVSSVVIRGQERIIRSLNNAIDIRNQIRERENY